MSGGLRVELNAVIVAVTDNEPRVLVGGDVLRGVDGKVHGALEERGDDSADEGSLAPRGVDRPVAHPVGHPCRGSADAQDHLAVAGLHGVDRDVITASERAVGLDDRPFQRVQVSSRNSV